MSSPTAGFFGGLLGSARKWLSPEASQPRLVNGYPISPPLSASSSRDGLVLYKGRQLKDMPISRLRKALAEFGMSLPDAALRSELVSRLASCINENASEPSNVNQVDSGEHPTSPAPSISERPSNKRKVPDEATSNLSEPAMIPHVSDEDETIHPAKRIFQGTTSAIGASPLAGVPRTSSTEENQHQGANVNVAQPYVAAEAMPFSFKRGVDAPQSRPVAPTGESQQQDANNAQIPAVPNIFQFPSKSGARRHESRPGPVAQLGENQHQAANVAQASVPSEVFPAFLEHGAEVRESGPRPVVQKEPLQAEGPNRSSNNNMTLKILETLEDMSRPFNDPSPEFISKMEVQEEPPFPDPDVTTFQADFHEGDEKKSNVTNAGANIEAEYSFRPPERVDSETPTKEKFGVPRDRFAFSPPGMPLHSPEPLLSPINAKKSKASRTGAVDTFVSSTDDEGKVLAATDPPTNTGASGWGDMFKKFEEGKWKCNVCLARNNEKDLKCGACETNRHGAAGSSSAVVEKKLDTAVGGGIGASGFTFGAPALSSVPSIAKNNVTVGFSFPVSTPLSASSSSDFVFSAPEDVSSETPKKASISDVSSVDRFAFSPPGLPLKSPEPLLSPAIRASSKPLKQSDTPGSSSSAEGSGWGDMFKKFEEGKWKCNVCLARNNEKDSKCVACETNRPGAAGGGGSGSSSASTTLGRGSSASGFTFGNSAPSGFNFSSAKADAPFTSSSESSAPSFKFDPNQAIPKATPAQPFAFSIGSSSSQDNDAAPTSFVFDASKASADSDGDEDNDEVEDEDGTEEEGEDEDVDNTDENDDPLQTLIAEYVEQNGSEPTGSDLEYLKSAAKRMVEDNGDQEDESGEDSNESDEADSEMRRCFETIDEDGDGLITAAEFRAFLASECEDLDAEQINEKVTEASALVKPGPSGKIDFSIFVQVLMGDEAESEEEDSTEASSDDNDVVLIDDSDEDGESAEKTSSAFTSNDHAIRKKNRADEEYDSDNEVCAPGSVSLSLSIPPPSSATTPFGIAPVTQASSAPFSFGNIGGSPPPIAPSLAAPTFLPAAKNAGAHNTPAFSFSAPEQFLLGTPKDGKKGAAKNSFTFSPPGMPSKQPEPLLSSEPKNSAPAESSLKLDTTEDTKASVGAESSAGASGWGDMFKKFEEGKWKCNVCLARNNEKDSKCGACETNRPGGAADGNTAVEKKPDTAISSGIGAGGFTFGVPASSSVAPAVISTATVGFSFPTPTPAMTSGSSDFVFSAPEDVSSETPKKASTSGGTSVDRFAFSPPGLPLKSPKPLGSPAVRACSKPTVKSSTVEAEKTSRNSAELDESSSSAGASGWGDMFKKFEEGKWKCGVCLARNNEKDSKCGACETNRPGTAADGNTAVEKKPDSATGGGIGASGFTFSAPASSSVPSVAKNTATIGFSIPTPAPALASGSSGFVFSAPVDVVSETPKKVSTSGANSTDYFAFSPPGLPLKSPEPLGSPAVRASSKSTVKSSTGESEKTSRNSAELDKTSSSAGASGWGDIFKKFEEGKWKCDVCLARNNEKDSKCGACETNRPGAAGSSWSAQEKKPDSATGGGIGAGGFTFGAPASSASFSSNSTGGTSSSGTDAGNFTFTPFGTPK